MVHIKLRRDHVCAADDYTCSGERVIFVDAKASVQEFLTEVLKAKFLQTSSSHQCLVAKADAEIALVVPDDGAVIPIVDLTAPISIYTINKQVSFSFSLSREQQSAYANYRRRQWGGS
jgi:hypothetical protein